MAVAVTFGHSWASAVFYNFSALEHQVTGTKDWDHSHDVPWDKMDFKKGWVEREKLSVVVAFDIHDDRISILKNSKVMKSHKLCDIAKVEIDPNDSRRFRLEFDNTKTMFEEMDKDDSGALDAKEVAALCKDMGRKMTKEDLAAAMAEMDEDGGGEVEFEEFSHWWAKNKPAEGIKGKKSKGNYADYTVLLEVFNKFDANILKELVLHSREHNGSIASLDDSFPKQTLHHGLLQVKTKNGFERKYCVLVKWKLYCYDDWHSKNIGLSLSLMGLDVQPDPKNKKLIMLDTHPIFTYLKASDEEERDFWVEMMREAADMSMGGESVTRGTGGMEWGSFDELINKLYGKRHNTPPINTRCVSLITIN